jgi:uncharacterized membrane protein
MKTALITIGLAVLALIFAVGIWAVWRIILGVVRAHYGEETTTTDGC